ncbi:hypothetical protein MKW92_020666 [Papaver armeniacum]|nr:hypothetical protein MKW92_020666 [Papaver armeniacum]
MAPSRPCVFNHLKTLAKPHHIRLQQQYPPCFFQSLRLLSFATPEDAAAERRRRKRRLHMEPPSNSLRQSQPQRPGAVPTVVTYNLLINAYCDCRRTDTALENYQQLIDNAPFSPSPATYRILVKGLVDNSKIEQALPQKDDMIEKGLKPDPAVYNYLMLGLVKNGDSDGALSLFEELKTKIWGSEAMDCYSEVVGENSSIRMNAVAYNSILDVLNKNGKFGEALNLFDKVCCEHNPPTKIIVNLGTFNKFKDAIEVSRNMGEKGINPDAVTYVLLMDACFSENRADDANGCYGKMLEFWLCFDQMVERLNPEVSCFKCMPKTLSESGKLEEVLKTIDGMLSDESVGLSSEMKKYVSDGLRKEGRDDELVQLIEEKEREKEEKERQKAANAGSKFFVGDFRGSRNSDKEGTEEGIEEVPAAVVVEEVPAPAAVEEIPAAEVIEHSINGDNLSNEVKQEIKDHSSR